MRCRSRDQQQLARRAATLERAMRLGGVGTLGYPISQRFEYGGLITQLFQNAALQWLPDFQQAVPATLGNRFGTSERLALPRAAYAVAEQVTVEDQSGTLSDTVDVANAESENAASIQSLDATSSDSASGTSTQSAETAGIDSDGSVATPEASVGAPDASLD